MSAGPGTVPNRHGTWPRNFPSRIIVDTPEQSFPQTALHNLPPLLIRAQQQEIHIMTRKENMISFTDQRTQAIDKIFSTLPSLCRAVQTDLLFIFIREPDNDQGDLPGGIA